MVKETSVWDDILQKSVLLKWISLSNRDAPPPIALYSNQISQTLFYNPHTHGHNPLFRPAFCIVRETHLELQSRLLIAYF